ncbi:hypothetical protein WICPIJ_001000 [Wickerhamomyces pijperi]|uniref:RRM domain-containing protein n=1 Tax=Wickerhamomyces pijperi TaxID=599730 RepID=A0A9P8TR15_WICPI|nr:hypothetical protein WICPIJ_001000 [Wickerhamomyces pijperi]
MFTLQFSPLLKQNTNNSTHSIIRNTTKLSEKELELNIPFSQSWHQDYSETAYIHFSSLPYDLTEGDILIIFSQYGIPVHMKLVRDKETGQSRGFGWLKYEDQRSTVLAVDNLNGTKILGRIIGVSHAVYEERDRDEEYEMMLEEELRNDFADVKNEQTEVAKEEGNDEFEDPLLLMINKEKKDDSHRHRNHRSSSERDRDREHRRSHRDSDDRNKDRDHHRSSRPHDQDRDRRSERSHRDRDSYRDREDRDKESRRTSHRDRASREHTDSRSRDEKPRDSTHRSRDSTHRSTDHKEREDKLRKEREEDLEL